MMQGWLSEFIFVLLHSNRTQVLLILGVSSFFGLSLYGEHAVNNLEFPGDWKPLEEAVRSKIMKHSDKAAWGLLVTCFWQACKAYKKDKDLSECTD